MTDDEPDDADGPAVEIALRVPGPWDSPEAFDAALPDGYRLGGDGETLWLYTSPDADGGEPGRVPLYIHPFDAEFVDVFAGGVGRLPSEADRAGVEQHSVLICPVFPGGSPERAAAALRHTAAVIRAGGVGVFVDNSGLAHGSDDWLALADATHDADAVDDAAMHAFVNVYGAADRLWSIGMHLLGHRDATLVDRSGDDERDDVMLRNALGYILLSGATIADGDRLDDVGAGETLVVSLIDDDEVAPDHPMHNPSGRYRLTRTPGVALRSPVARGPA